MADPPPCELCSLPSLLLCPSDNAFLCCSCDSVVHSANFLVARHLRSFLCPSCSSPSSCLKSGPRLLAEFHLCRRCAPDCSNSCCSDPDLDDGALSSITQAAPSFPSSHSCSNLQELRDSGRTFTSSGSCECSGRKRSRDLAQDEGSSDSSVVPALSESTETSCEAKIVAAESVSEVDDRPCPASSDGKISSVPLARTPKRRKELMSCDSAQR